MDIRQTFFKFFLDAYERMVAFQAPEIANILEEDLKNIGKQRGNLLELAKSKLKSSKVFLDINKLIAFELLT